ncbi:hypothetical protein Ddye_011186 [Dipteronia dyeriana]|uniref:Uncharacterized protein n=1 Tax=Dipteronia dyeriana TaxID=168575 RepID=A0AAE0CP11_9ROSI|nr:hypothetical protein Ddye_011186 [Dipteronia dyeriana]
MRIGRLGCTTGLGISSMTYLKLLFYIPRVDEITRRETFTNLSDVWTKKVELYSTNQYCVKMLVGNKVDRERAVSREEGIALAKEHGCSAKTGENVKQCFEELALKILEVRKQKPEYPEPPPIEGSTVVKPKHEYQASPSGGVCCS